MKPLNGASVCPYCQHNALSPNITSPHHLKPGTVLHDRYLVGEVLGEGGFGITYIGLDQTLSKRVAVKEFFPSGAANRSTDLSGSVVISSRRQDFFRNGVSRFLDEAKNVAAFSSEDGIVDVLDYFEENNTAYIVMEYLEGETLKDRVSRDKFAPNELITRLRPVMQALSAMHRKGVIHRDISPDNIMLTKSGKLVLMDFGSARYFTNKESNMSVVIKVGFAPEEQYRQGSKQGPFTDVYALCATIYYCITGTMPVESLERTNHDTLQPPSRLGVAISPKQEAALMHGLAVDAANRCPDMDTLMREFNDTHTQTVAADGLHTVIPPVQGSYRKPEFNANYHDDYSRRVPPRQQQQPPVYPNAYHPGGYAQPTGTKSNAPIIAAIIVTTVAILAVGGVIVYLLLSKNAEPTPTGAGGNDSFVTTEPSSQESSYVEHSSDVIVDTWPTESSSYSSVPLRQPPDAKERLNEITAMFSEDNPHMSEARDGGAYDYVAQSNGRIWVGTKGSFYDDENEKTWYLFDSDHKLYFVYKNAPESEYRYYVYKDTVFKYTVGPTGDQANYMLPDDAVMQTETVQGIVAEAYDALGNLSY